MHCHVAAFVACAALDVFADPRIENSRAVGGDMSSRFRLGHLIQCEASDERRFGERAWKIVRLPMADAAMKTRVIVHHLRAEKDWNHAEHRVKIGSARLPGAEELAETVEGELVSPEIARAEFDAVDPFVHDP